MIRVLSLLCLCCTFVVGSSSISRRGEEGRSQIVTALADQAFRDVSARVSAGIMISRRAVRGRYRYAGTAFVTAQQLRSMLVVDYILLEGARASRVCPRANVRGGPWKEAVLRRTGGGLFVYNNSAGGTGRGDMSK
jgi:hypothetical protein